MASSPMQHGNIVTMQENNEIFLIFFSSSINRIYWCKEKPLAGRLARYFLEKYQSLSIHNETGLILFWLYSLFRLVLYTKGRSRMRWKPHVRFWDRDFLSKMNDRNGCWLNPKDIMRNLCKIIMKLRDLKPIPMIEVIYSITSIKEDV
jgi:hypothetical protein